MRSGRSLKLACLFFLTSILFAEMAVAEEEMDDNPASLEWSSTVVARLNARGLIAANRLTLKHRLYKSSSSVLENNFIGFSMQPWVSPAWFRPGFKFEIQPASVANFAVTYEYISYFGTFDILQSFDSPEADYSSARQEDRAELGLDYSTVGQQLTLSGLLQAKVGPIAARNTFKMFYVNYDLDDGDTHFYDPTLDIMLKNQGWGFENDADLLYVSDFGLIAGIRYTVTNAYYDDAFENLNQMQRIGPLVTYKFYDKPNEQLSEITGIFLANWWLKHRYRAGQEVSQALPSLAFGARFSGRLF